MSHHAAAYGSLANAAPRHHERGHRDAANRAVLVSAIGLRLTGGLELAIAVLTGSVALLGDALHNLADVSTSVVVFLGFFISERRPSPEYPYGYERAEDVAGSVWLWHLGQRQLSSLPTWAWKSLVRSSIS